MSDLRLIAEGHTASIFEDDHGLFQWNRCAVPGCGFYARLRESSIYCTPHTRQREAGATILEMIAKPNLGVSADAKTDSDSDNAE